jgi:CRISPR-associated protein Csd2
MSIQNRYDFVLLFDVKDGNPNGDPDAGNMPRMDPETGAGLVTDVCLKRKVRNYIGLLKGDDEHYGIYIREKAILNQLHDDAYKLIAPEELTKEVSNDPKEKPKRKGGDKVELARKWMCEHFYDVRTFGAVMSTGTNCGQVRGPIQITFARSLDPISISEHSITRMAVTTEEEAKKQVGDNRTMGRKSTIPYGLYRAHGYISAHLAEQTGFDENDLEIFWEALQNMFEHDRSAARGEMNVRGLYVFKHDTKLGCTHAHKLFDQIHVSKRTGVEVPRSIADYEVTVPSEEGMPAGVQLKRFVG